MICRFENRLSGQAMRLTGWQARIEACQASEVVSSLDAIEQARCSGHWVALLLDYELGEWLLPEVVSPPAVSGAQAAEMVHPRLTALVFAQMVEEPVWPATDALPATGYISQVRARLPKADYLDQIGQIRQRIAAGELYQLNYTQPLDVQAHGDPQQLYRRIAASNPVAHGAYIEDGRRCILSFSPELFVQRQGARLSTRPMKGTAPRHANPARDQQLGLTLQNSAKDRAENVMIVDLLRNDLGRLARPGSVQVDALFALEQYPTFWAMTSSISAQAPDASLEDVLRALFPCGSITGAPKIAAMRHIRHMEAARRGLYCGSLGWLAPNGDFSLNVAIRTLVLDEQGQGVYSVGGGIVHDSDAEQEWQECGWKARILQSAASGPLAALHGDVP